MPLTSHDGPAPPASESPGRPASWAGGWPPPCGRAEAVPGACAQPRRLPRGCRARSHRGGNADPSASRGGGGCTSLSNNHPPPTHGTPHPENAARGGDRPLPPGPGWGPVALPGAAAVRGTPLPCCNGRPLGSLDGPAPLLRRPPTEDPWPALLSSEGPSGKRSLASQEGLAGPKESQSQGAPRRHPQISGTPSPQPQPKFSTEASAPRTAQDIPCLDSTASLESGTPLRPPAAGPPLLRSSGPVAWTLIEHQYPEGQRTLHPSLGFSNSDSGLWP
nr:pecanex-like protein 3 [Globicephala melas]